MVIYADVVFLMNFVSSALLLFAYRLIFAIKCRNLKLLIGALLSGLYAVIEVVCNLPYILRTAVLFCVTAVAFGIKGSLYNTIRLMFVVIGLEAVYAIIMTALGSSILMSYGTVTVFANDMLGAVIYILSYPTLFAIRYFAKRKSRARKADFTINGFELQLNLLYDSGNLLSHKGLSAAVISWESVSGIFRDMTYEEFKFNTEDVILFNTVGSGGFMPVVKPQKSIIDGGECEIYLAVADRKFGRFDGIIGDTKNKFVGEEIKCSF